MSDFQMVGTAQPELAAGCWAGRPESSRGGGRGGWVSSGGRKKLSAMQSSQAGGVGSVAAAGGGDKAFPRQINNRIIAAANSDDIVALLWVIKCNLADMNMVNLSTSIHRLAKLAATDMQTQPVLGSNEVVRALLATIRSKLVHARVDSNLQQSLSNIAWSLATMQIEDVEVLVLVADLALKAIDGFKAYEISTLVWAFAKLYGIKGLPPSAKRVFFAAANQSPKDLQSFSFRSLANIVWAYATGGVRHFRLFTNIAREMMRTAESANCQGIANTIWAFSTAGHSDQKLFDVLTEAALPIMKDFKAQELSSMLWGLATSGFVKEDFFTVALDTARAMDLGPQQLANIFWACAKVLPNHAVTQAVVVEFLPRVAGKFMAFKPQEVSSLMNALAKIAAVDDEDATVLNGALILPPYVYQSIYAFLRFATPWFKEHLCNLSSMTFTSVVCIHEFFGLEEEGVGQLVEQQVIDRVETLSHMEVLQLLRAILSSRASSQAVCVLAGNLARNFELLQPREIRQLKQLAAAFHQPRLQFPPDKEKVYSWCLALAVNLPQLSHGSLAEALGDDEDEGPLAVCTHEGSKGEVEGTPELLDLDSLAAEADDDVDSILSLEPGDFYKECRIASVESLPNFPSTPEDSDDEYCKALFAQQAKEARSMNSSGGGAVANSNLSRGTSPYMYADNVGMMPVALMQPYACQM